jgi:hypothetical protein
MSATTTPGAPKGELEQYGVWVKAEPRDLEEEASGLGASELDFEISDVSNPVPEESFLSEDEERLLSSFDSEPSSETVSTETGPLPDIEDMPPLDDAFMGTEPSPSMETVQNIDTGSVDISLDDIPSAQIESPIHPGVEIDMDSVVGLDATPHTAESAPAGTIEDVSSEFLDIAEVAAPPVSQEAQADSGFSSGLDDVTAEFMDVGEAPAAPLEEPPVSDFEPLDIDLQFDDSMPAFSAEEHAEDSGPEPGFEAVTEFDDFLASSGNSAPAPESLAIPEIHAPAAQEAFDDIGAVERELAAPIQELAPLVREAPPEFYEAPPEPREAPPKPREAPPEPREAPPKPDLSTEILLKIADELSSIRGELVSLKSQISGIVTGAEAPAPKTEIESAMPPSGGFFDDEEDETIALTGDELDNILNTADFTEETAEVEQPLDLESKSLGESSPAGGELLDESLLPESGDYSAPEEPAIEEVRLGKDMSFEKAEEEPAFLAEDLNLVAEAGVTPMTPAPDDSSFLEQTESLELAPSMEDQSIVGTDLSAFDLDTDENEPRLEIEEELPLADSEAELEPLEDLTLGIEAGPGYAAEEVVDEAELLEPVPEIEETNFAEISLHEEQLEAPSALETEGLEELVEADEQFAEPFAEPLVESFAEPPAVSQVAEPTPAAPVLEGEDLILGEEETPLSREAPAETKAEKEDNDRLRTEIKSVLSYLDKLLDSLPEEKIEEFARSEYFDTYKKLFEELGLV